MAAEAAPEASLRLGFAQDRHPFGPGEPLRLGGIAIDGAPRLHGHSDGDAALHAVAGALLGAGSLGDLGSLFPADRGTPRGVASSELLAAVVARLASSGWRPETVNLTITAARPWLGSRLPAMRDAISALLEVLPDAVSVEASTGNLSGDDGAGRTVSATAVVTVVPTPRS